MKGCQGFQQSFANRREFMQVGFAGGLGLALPELMKVEANAAAKFYESKEGRRQIAHSHLSSGRLRSPGNLGSQALCSLGVPRPLQADQNQCSGNRVFRKHGQHGQGSRQDLCDPLDEPRGSSPRARHSQHVHRLSSEPGDQVPQFRFGDFLTSLDPARICLPTSVFPTSPTNLPERVISVRCMVRLPWEAIPRPTRDSRCAI